MTDAEKALLEAVLYPQTFDTDLEPLRDAVLAERLKTGAEERFKDILLQRARDSAAHTARISDFYAVFGKPPDSMLRKWREELVSS